MDAGKKYSQKQTVLGNSGGGFGQQVDIHAIQQEYLDGKGKDSFGFLGYKSSDKLKSTAKPWMTLSTQDGHCRSCW